jgi:glucan biosynthesis protein C
LDKRRHDIDWLRIFAVYLLFVYHVAKIFDATPFMHIKNREISDAMGVFTWSIKLWHMPLFFLLAGWAASVSLRARGPAGFARERVFRLLVPFLAGCCLICPPMVFIEMQSRPGFDMSFIRFLPHFFTSLHYFSWSHLWFLAYLITFTLLYFPLFRWLSHKESRSTQSAVAWVYLPVIPLVLIQAGLRERWPGLQNLYDDWANFAYFSAFLILGFLFAQFQALERAVHKEWPRTLLIGVAAIVVTDFMDLARWPKTTWGVTAFAGYFTVLGLLGLGRRYASFDHRFLPYLTESAYPVYILHQLGIVVSGFFILMLPWGIAGKYLLTLFVAVTATLTVYHFLVRRIPACRFLFGIKSATT